ncbi:MAG: hypothetical protein AAFO04_17790 [Cyanobacteria bacterium J06592_8]
MIRFLLSYCEGNAHPRQMITRVEEYDRVNPLVGGTPAELMNTPMSTERAIHQSTQTRRSTRNAIAPNVN